MKKFTYYSFLLFVLSAYTGMGANGPGKNIVNTPPFYTEDFSGGIPAGWQNNDMTSPPTGAIWKYTTTGNSTGFDALNPTGTTASNGYMIFDSDEIFGTNGDAWLITSAINCTGKANVHLTFNEFYKQDQDCVGEVYVSTDGVNWGSPIYDASTGLAGGDATSNPNANDIDISATADGQATLYVAFRFFGNSGYYWMVDDIGLYELGSYDAGITGINSPATTCNTLTNAENVCVKVKNFGLSPLTNVPVSYVLDGGTPVSEVISTTIDPGDSLVYCFTQTADLSVAGSHTIVVTTSYLGDADNSNDLSTSKFYLGPHSLVYTQGFEIPTEDISGWFIVDANTDGTIWLPSASSPHTGNVCADFSHDLPTNDADDWLISPCLDFTNATYSYKVSFWDRTFSSLTDANLEVVLLSAQNPTAVVQTLLASTTVTNETYEQVSANFAPPSGIYYIGWHVTNTAKNTSLKIDDINVDFDTKTSDLSFNGTDVIIYPNPNNGIFSVGNLKSFNRSTQVTVLDMMGRTVYEQTTGGLDKITMNLANQAAGVYTVRISNDAQVLNKLITITK